MRWMLMAFLALAGLSAQDWSPARVAEAMGSRDYVLLFDTGTKVARWTRRVKPDHGFTPCSTFKLPHALIALEAGVLPLDRQRQTCVPAECHGDHGVLDLAGAIRESCVSYFRQTARVLGPERMAQGLEKLGYTYSGTLDPPDGFWLEGRMRVTPEQQLRWIRRFYTEPLGVKPEHLALVRKATERQGTEHYALQGKTGSSREGHGWFIGQVTRDGAAAWVVLFLRGKGASGLEAERRLRLLLDPAGRG